MAPPRSPIAVSRGWLPTAGHVVTPPPPSAAWRAAASFSISFAGLVLTTGRVCPHLDCGGCGVEEALAWPAAAHIKPAAWAPSPPCPDAGALGWIWWPGGWDLGGRREGRGGIERINRSGEARAGSRHRYFPPRGRVLPAAGSGLQPGEGRSWEGGSREDLVWQGRGGGEGAVAGGSGGSPPTNAAAPPPPPSSPRPFDPPCGAVELAACRSPKRRRAGWRSCAGWAGAGGRGNAAAMAARWQAAASVPSRPRVPPCSNRPGAVRP